MVLPTLLQMPSVRCPFRLLSRRAAKVSIVSPLWLIAKTRVSLFIGMLRYRNSLANSTSVGIWARLSIRHSPTLAAWRAVPQAVKTMRSTSRNSRDDILSPPSLAVHSSRERRPRIASRMAFGCSKISFSMKWGKRSQVDVFGRELDLAHLERSVGSSKREDVELISLNRH